MPRKYKFKPGDQEGLQVTFRSAQWVYLENCCEECQRYKCTACKEDFIVSSEHCSGKELLFKYCPLCGANFIFDGIIPVNKRENRLKEARKTHVWQNNKQKEKEWEVRVEYKVFVPAYDIRNQRWSKRRYLTEQPVVTYHSFSSAQYSAHQVYEIIKSWRTKNKAENHELFLGREAYLEKEIKVTFV